MKAKVAKQLGIDIKSVPYSDAIDMRVDIDKAIEANRKPLVVETALALLAQCLNNHQPRAEAEAEAEEAR